MHKIKMTPEKLNWVIQSWYTEGHIDAMSLVLRNLRVELDEAMYQHRNNEVDIEWVNAIAYTIGVVSQLSRVAIDTERVEVM